MRSREETELVKAILLAFGKRPDLRLWRQNTGAARTPSGRLVRFGVPGAADISGIWERLYCSAEDGGGELVGQRIEIECKTATGKLRAAQENYRDMIEAFGGLYILARSLKDVTDVLGEP